MTQYDYSGVQRVRAAVESAFGTDMTSDIATNFFDVRAADHVEIMRGTVTADDTTVVQRPRQQNDIVVSAIDRWKCSLKAFWTNSGEAVTAAVTATKTAQSKILEVLFGGYYVDQGSDSASGEATTGCIVTGGHGGRFEEGQLIGVTVAGVVYPRMIKTISTDTLTWWPDLPAAPATGGDILNGQNTYFTDAPSGSLQLLVEKAVDRNDIYLGTGARGTLSLDVSRGNLITWTADLAGALVKHDDEMTTPLTSASTIAAATYTGGAPVHSMNGALHFGPTASGTLTLIRDAGLAINFGMAEEEVGQFSGIDGLGQYAQNPRGPVTIELTIPGAHETYQDAFLAGTKYGLLFNVGATGGAIFAFAASTMQIVAPPEPVAIGAMRGVKLSLRCQENSLCTNKTTHELRRSPCVLAAI